MTYTTRYCQQGHELRAPSGCLPEQLFLGLRCRQPPHTSKPACCRRTTRKAAPDRQWEPTDNGGCKEHSEHPAPAATGHAVPNGLFAIFCSFLAGSEQIIKKTSACILAETRLVIPACANALHTRTSSTAAQCPACAPPPPSSSLLAAAPGCVFKAQLLHHAQASEEAVEAQPCGVHKAP